jgi:hypothetical protein
MIGQVMEQTLLEALVELRSDAAAGDVERFPWVLPPDHVRVCCVQGHRGPAGIVGGVVTLGTQ